MTHPIFVFGSNLAGRHGKGAALFARNERGAIYGCGVGPQGNSYGIPTKDHALATLPLSEIARYAAGFLAYARAHPDCRFELTPIGCGLAGYRAADIAPLFADAPGNVALPQTFTDALASRAPTEPLRAIEEQPAHFLAPIAERIDRDARDAASAIIPANAIAGFFGRHRFLSNFWYAGVSLYDELYPSVEHAYQAAKAINEADRARIRCAATPAEAKRLGQRVTIRPDWERTKVVFMLILVRRKFRDADLARQLLATGGAPIFEDTTRWKDTVWGVVRDGHSCQGGNRLGRILESVRAELQSLNPTW